MGKLKELIQEYMKAPRGSPAEADIASEIGRISDWMIQQGYSEKSVTLPDKKYKYGSCRFRSKREQPCSEPKGHYGFCPHHEEVMARANPSHYQVNIKEVSKAFG